jgi:hypothetical protein
LQFDLIERFTPGAAYGDYFLWFVLFECGGALEVLFSTLFRERTKSMKAASGAKSAAEQER